MTYKELEALGLFKEMAIYEVTQQQLMRWHHLSPKEVRETADKLLALTKMKMRGSVNPFKVSQKLGDEPIPARAVALFIAKLSGWVETEKDGATSAAVKKTKAAATAKGRTKVLAGKAAAKEERREKAERWYRRERSRFTTKDRAAEELACVLGIEFKPARALIKQLDDCTALTERGTLSVRAG